MRPEDGLPRKDSPRAYLPGDYLRNAHARNGLSRAARRSDAESNEGCEILVGPAWIVEVYAARGVAGERKTAREKDERAWEESGRARQVRSARQTGWVFAAAAGFCAALAWLLLR